MVKVNESVADHLNKIADMLEMTEDEINANKVFGYRKAADAINTFPVDIRTIEASALKSTIKGIGDSTGRCILEFLSTGTSSKYQELLQQVPPPSVMELTKLEGIGVREAKILYQSYGVKNLSELGECIKQGKIWQKTIIQAYKSYQQQTQRILYQDAVKIVGSLLEAMRQLSEVKKIAVAGSIRRSCATIANVNLLCVATDRDKVAKYLATWEDELKGLEVLLTFCEEEQWTAKLFRLTGSKEYNEKNIVAAQNKQMSLSEYGVALPTGKVVGDSEENICQTIGVPYYIPELRDLVGSIKDWPKINPLDKTAVSGDAHVHTSVSKNASGSVTNYARSAIKLGYRYLIFTDYDDDLNDSKLQAQFAEIEEFNKLGQILLLKGIEVEISPKGNFRYDNKILCNFNVVAASIHSHFDLEGSAQTARLVEAIRHPYVKIIAHPECSVYGKQEGLKCNWDTVFEECVRYNVALEISGNPNRIGFAPTWLWKAKKMGVKFVLGSDAHSISTLSDISYALIRARRAGIEKEDLWDLSMLTQDKKL